MSDNRARDALGRIFAEFCSIDDGDLPMLPIPDGATAEMFVGEPDAEGWIRWRPKIKTELFDLSKLEENAQLRIHHSIKELLDAWWFGYLSVSFQEYQFEIDPIIPGNYRAAFLLRLLGYRQAHGGHLNHIPIGIDSEHGHLLVVSNASGVVYVEDVESGCYKELCGSLSEFFLSCGQR